MRSIKIITLLIICVSCNIENNTPGKIKLYFPVDSVLIQQKELLEELNPVLQKVAWVDQKMDTTTMRLDSAGWAKEMQIFDDISINKPALRDSYLKDTVNSNNGISINYSAREDLKEDLEIEYMHIHFDPKKQLKKIELLYKEKSSLYKAKRLMELNFSEKERFSSYHVEGYQKIVLKDTIRYRINASIIYQ